jgi:putative thioredoxin
MADMTYKIAATAENFMTAVVEASNDRPVLVDFWAPWCGPCQALMPMLEQVADDYAGRFLLAKVNTDEEEQLATHFQVRSIPMLMLVHKGEIAEQLIGAQPEVAIRALLDKYLGDAPAVLESAAGHTVAETASAEPGGPIDAPPQSPPGAAVHVSDQPADRALHALERRDATGAAAAIDALAASSAEHPLLKSLRARLAFLELANAHPDTNSLRARLEAAPGDVAARHALAAHYALIGDYGTALAEWLEVMRRDRKFDDDAGRRALVQAFDVLGEQDPLVVQYRRRMASLLH